MGNKGSQKRSEILEKHRKSKELTPLEKAKRKLKERQKQQLENPPRFGGWPVTTYQDPRKVLYTIWETARLDYTGLKGWKSDDETILEFSGIRIRIGDDDPLERSLQHTLYIEITDDENIQPEFFDMWEYLKKSGLVFGGPTLDDKEKFTFSGPEKYLRWLVKEFFRAKKEGEYKKQRGQGIDDWIGKQPLIYFEKYQKGPFSATYKEFQRMKKYMIDNELV